MFDNINNRTLVIVVLMFICFGWLLYESGLLLIWLEDEEYGHGLLVIGLLVYLVYRNRGALILSHNSSRWMGVLISISALLIFTLGEMSGILQIRMYSIWLFAIAAIFSIGGWILFKTLLIPVFIIFLLIPLPDMIGQLLTAELQLISSILGVWLIRLFDGVVFLEGNIIDMGGVKLLVAEACSGLRYLFPLMSIGAIAGYIMQAPIWMRWTIFLATIPITILMNSFRIGITGLLTEAYGSSHTDGFIHFFEGWVVFVASLIILIALAWLLLRMLPAPPSFIEVFSFDHIPSNKEIISSEKIQDWQTSSTVMLMFGSLLAAVIVSSSLIEYETTTLKNKSLSQFPELLGVWRASESRLPPSIEAVAGASDYFYGDFISPAGGKVNLYIAYYHDQKKGVAPHSPKVCIPGDGWVIKNNEALQLKSKSGRSIKVSRLIITKGDKKIITYYWLKQGDKIFDQQLMARLDLVRFVITENRADAALIRLVSEVGYNEKIEYADTRIQQVADELLAVISEYVPD